VLCRNSEQGASSTHASTASVDTLGAECGAELPSHPVVRAIRVAWLDVVPR
jgi:hypothetical protein